MGIRHNLCSLKTPIQLHKLPKAFLACIQLVRIFFWQFIAPKIDIPYQGRKAIVIIKTYVHFPNIKLMQVGLDYKSRRLH